jgi:putative sigma-54 modulation protein
MNVQYTGRQESITPAVRKQVDARLRKIKKVLGARAVLEVRVILTQEKRAHRAEINVNVFDNSLSANAEAPEMILALNESLDHLEKQALKQKSRWRERTRRVRPASSRSIKTLTVLPAA